MAHSSAVLTRAFSDQFEPDEDDHRSSDAGPSVCGGVSTMTHACKGDRRSVDVVVHLSGGRVLRPVLVHPDTSHRSAPTQTTDSLSHGAGTSPVMDDETLVRGGTTRLQSSVNAINVESPTPAVRCWSSTSANIGLSVSGSGAVATSRRGGGTRRPTLDSLRADSEPCTWTELDRHRPRPSNHAQSVVISVDEIMCHRGVAAESTSATSPAAAATAEVASMIDSVHERSRYRRESKARRRIQSTTSSGVVGSLADNERLTGAPESTADRRHRSRLRINVSGQYFEIGRRALARHPTTLLGNGARRTRYYDAERDEFFFDRHRPSFEAIFAYFQTGGRLRRPFNVPDDIFLDELMFYELESNAVDEYKRSEGYSFEQLPMPSNELQRRIWTLFEHPETSHTAFFIAVLSVVMTLVSIVLFCVETLPMFSETHCVADEAPNFFDPFFIIETTCTTWFTIEAIIRFAACPSKIDFWKDFKNIVDVMAVVPYYVTLFNVLSTMSCEGAKSSASLSFLRVIRLVRVFKLTKHSVGLQVLVMTFKASLEGLGLFLVALFVSLLVFSSAIYYAELGQRHSQMKSIPDAFWWAIITMTTVGYGDKVPVGPMGRLIGAACAITGVLTLAIPVPIITGHFNRFYSHKTGRGRHT